MTPKNLFLTLTLAVGLTLAPAWLPAAASTSANSALDTTLEIASGRFAGVLAVRQPGKAPEYRTHVPPSGSSGWTQAYPLASVTKVFTATAVLALYEQGRLDLDATLASILPAYADRPAAAVTIRQLLNHTSGIPSVLQTGQGLDATLDPATWPLPSTLEEQLAPVLPMTLLFAPGSRYAYSNSGYLILARVLEQVTGEPYAQAIGTLALAPAGVADQACFCTDLPNHSDVVPQEWDGDGTRAAVLVHPTRSAAAGGLRMTPEALMTWMSALVEGRILKPETLALAWTPGPPTRQTGESMGLGWLVRDQDGHRVVLHDGALPGATATVAIDTHTRALAIGLLSPTLPLEQLSFSEDYLRERVVALAQAERPATLPKGPGTAPKALAGDYQLPDGRTLRLARADGRWSAQISNGGSPLELRQAVHLETPFAKTAVEAGTALIRGGQPALLPLLSDSLKAQLPPKALDQFVAGWIAQRGAFQAVHAYATNARKTSAHLRFQFEHGAVDVGFNYADGKLDGLQLLGESRAELPNAVEVRITERGSLWLDGYRQAAPAIEIHPVLKGKRVVGLSLDPDRRPAILFPRAP